MESFKVPRGFPREERYSLTDQIRRASRSVPENIAEGYGKRRYQNLFVLKMVDADGEAAEAQVWLDFARDCGYIRAKKHEELASGYEEVGRMLGGMIEHPERFCS
jgi:four helix bundle protein